MLRYGDVYVIYSNSEVIDNYRFLVFKLFNFLIILYVNRGIFEN